MTEQEIETEKQKLLDAFRDKERFTEYAYAISLVRSVIATTEERIRLGYLPNLSGPALNTVITMEYIYRSGDLDIEGYNEPVCCTPFYYEAMKEEING